jgi:hypothetical protein
MGTLIRGFLILLAAGVAAIFATKLYKDNQPDTPDDGPKRPNDQAPEPEREPAPSEAVTEVDEVDSSSEAITEVDEVDEVADEPITVKGVTFDNPKRALAFANDAAAEMLEEAGLNANARKALIGGRPFADMSGLEATKGIGKKTLESIRDA